jgi:acyl-coenzyme A thioesterase PaaI-like protein
VSFDMGWSATSDGPPSVDQIEAMGVAMSVYLPTAMEESADPHDPDGPPRVTGHCELPDHLRDEQGRIATGVLATLVDNVGGMVSGLSALPDWIVTTNLSLRRPTSVTAATPGPLTIEARVLRRGRNSVVAGLDVSDAHGAPVATAWMTSAVLVPEAGPPPVPRPPRRRAFPAVDDPLYRSSPSSFFAVEDCDRPGEVRIDAPPRLRNPWGIVHGGALAVAVDAAARAAVAHPTGIDVAAEELLVSDMVVHYLSPARVGPIVARGELVGDRGTDHLVRVAVQDQGADDRSLVLAVASVSAPG